MRNFWFLWLAYMMTATLLPFLLPGKNCSIFPQHAWLTIINERVRTALSLFISQTLSLSLLYFLFLLSWNAKFIVYFYLLIQVCAFHFGHRHFLILATNCPNGGENFTENAENLDLARNGICRIQKRRKKRVFRVYSEVQTREIC